MSSLDNTIVDSSQMVSLLLVYVSVLFGIQYSEIAKLLREDVPDVARMDARREFRERLSDGVKKHVVPVALPSFAIGSVLAPITLQIVDDWLKTISSLDVVRQLFLFVEIALLGSILWCVVISIAFARRIRDAK